MSDADPHPAPDRFIGKTCSFDGSAGRRLSGLVLAQMFIGLTDRGKIPNYRLTVQGSSGKTVEVDLVEQHVSLKS